MPRQVQGPAPISSRSRTQPAWLRRIGAPIALASALAAGCQHCRPTASCCPPPAAAHHCGLPQLGTPCDFDAPACGQALPVPTLAGEARGPLATPGMPDEDLHSGLIPPPHADIPLPPADDDGSSLPVLESTRLDDFDAERPFFNTSGEVAPQPVRLLSIEDGEELPVLEEEPAPLVSPSAAVVPVESGLRITRAALCSEIRAFDEITELDATHLSAGQPVLVYLALDGTTSETAGGAVWTRTESTLQILSGGLVIAEQNLGEAVDAAREERSEYFVTHKLLVPSGLGTGPHVFRLIVRDVHSGESTASDLPVCLDPAQGGS
jgi:hypothetical protein